MTRYVAIMTVALWAGLGCSQTEGKEKPKAAAAKKAAPVKKAASKPAAKGSAKGPEVSQAALAEAQKIFQGRCATCHGPKGAGDGPAAAALNPKPRSLRDPAWQKSVTNEHIAKVTVGGGQAVGLSPMMTANPDLKGKPEVVQGLVKIIRDLSM